MSFNSISRYLVAVVLVMSVSGVAFAAAEVRYYNWHDIAWRVANFVVFASLIVYLFKRYGVGALESYRKGVDARIASSKANRDEAEKEMESYRQEIESLSARLEGLKAEAAVEAEAQKAAVIRGAHERAEVIAEKYSTELQVAVDAMRQEIMGEVFEDAVRLAVEKLEQGMSEQDARRFTAQSFENINLQGAKGGSNE